MLSRQYYEPVEFFRRGDSGLRMPLGQNSSLLDQYETNSQMSRRTTPSSETDRHGAAPRKRVPVACHRCRKRKIKCSGDEGGGCSNCRNAGHAGCQFLRVCSTSLSDPTSLAILRHNQLRSQQAQAAQYSAHTHYGPASSSSSIHQSQRYHPYSLSPSASYRTHHSHGHGHHSHHGHQYGTSPQSSHSAYSPHPTTPYPGLQSEYALSTTTYTGSVSQGGLPWARTGSGSGFSSNSYCTYNADEVASPYTSQQPASFLLPVADPMTSSSGGASGCGSYSMNPYSTGRSHSQGQVWGEGMAAGASVIGAYGQSAGEAGAYDTSNMMAMHGGGAGMSGKESCLPYQLITNGTGSNGGSSDRTLPTPGSRQYTSSMSGTSTLDALPLSALSHRSSIGWSTDSASSASHISSQTSVTGSSIAGHDFSGERSDGHRTSDSQEIAFNYLGFSNSPQASMPNSTLPGANDDLSSSNSSLTYRLSKNDSQISDIDHSSTMPGQASHQQRCRTISASSTPNLIPTTSQCCHGSLSGNVQAESSNHNSNNNNNSGDLSDSGASSAAALTSSSTTASIIAASAGPGGNSTASSSLADAYGYTAAPSVTHRTQSQTRGVGLGTASGSGEGLGLGRPSNGYTYTRASGVKDYGGGVAAGAGGGRAEDYAAAGLQGSEGLSIGIGGSCQPASSTAGSVGLGGGGGGSRANVASISNLAGY